MRPLEAADRGAIVGRRDQFGVVWWGCEARHLIFPIEDAEPAFAGDVPIGADLALFAGRVIRVRAPIWVSRDGRDLRGALPGHVIERVAAAVARLGREGRFSDVWHAWKDGPRYNEERCVCL